MGEQNATKLAITLVLKTNSIFFTPHHKSGVNCSLLLCVFMRYILSNVLEDRIPIARSLQPKLLMHDVVFSKMMEKKYI